MYDPFVVGDKLFNKRKEKPMDGRNLERERERAKPKIPATRQRGSWRWLKGRGGNTC